jgi:hypothetical protein
VNSQWDDNDVEGDNTNIVGENLKEAKEDEEDKEIADILDTTKMTGEVEEILLK